MEMNAVLKVNWCSTLMTVKDEKKGFKVYPIVDWKAVKPKLGFFCRKGASED